MDWPESKTALRLVETSPDGETCCCLRLRACLQLSEKSCVCVRNLISS